LDARNFNFLNRLNKITDAKSALKEGNQQKTLQGDNLQEIFSMRITQNTLGKDLLTIFFIIFLYLGDSLEPLKLSTLFAVNL
jgi:hypothetical protein